MNKHLPVTDDLLVKYMLGEAAPQERLHVDRWLEEDVANAKYYEHFTLIWEESKALSATVTVDEQVAWNRFKSSIEKKTLLNKKEIKPRTFIWVKRLAVAAVLLLMAGIVWLSRTGSKSSEVVMLRKHASNLAIVDTLTDGTIITLNKNTTLQYPSHFTGNTRNVTLKGEAFFSVAHNKAKPFIIHANNVTITVVGTAFNVKNYHSTTQIIVESGVVRVKHNRYVIELRKGEQATITGNGNAPEKSFTKDSLYQYYRTKEFVCNNTPLPVVLQSLNEAYHTHLAVGSNDVKQLRLSATFKEAESIETIVAIIEQTFNLQSTASGDSIILNMKKMVPGKTDTNR